MLKKIVFFLRIICVKRVNKIRIATYKNAKHLEKKCDLTEPLQKKCDVTKPSQKKCDLTEPSQKKCDVTEPSQKKCDVHHHTFQIAFFYTSHFQIAFFHTFGALLIIYRCYIDSTRFGKLKHIYYIMYAHPAHPKRWEFVCVYYVVCMYAIDIPPPP